MGNFFGHLIGMAFKLLAGAGLLYFALRGYVAVGETFDAGSAKAVTLLSTLALLAALWLMWQGFFGA